MNTQRPTSARLGEARAALDAVAEDNRREIRAAADQLDTAIAAARTATEHRDAVVLRSLEERVITADQIAKAARLTTGRLYQIKSAHNRKA